MKKNSNISNIFSHILAKEIFFSFLWNFSFLLFNFDFFFLHLISFHSQASHLPHLFYFSEFLVRFFLWSVVNFISVLSLLFKKLYWWMAPHATVYATQSRCNFVDFRLFWSVIVWSGSDEIGHLRTLIFKMSPIGPNHGGPSDSHSI